MKILQVIPNLGMGGAENMCETLSGELALLHHEVTVISLYSHRTAISDRLIDSGVPVVFLDKKKGLDLSCVMRLRKYILQNKPDVIHTHLYALKYVALATAGTSTRIVHTIHTRAEKESKKADRRFNGFLYRHKKAVPVALSGEIQKTVMNEYHLPAMDIPVVFNGVRLGKCVVKDVCTAHTPFVFVCVARFSAVKAHDRLLRAFKTLSDETDGVELWLIGDGELRNPIESQIDSLQLGDKVKLLGVQTDVFRYLTKADCFVLSSDYEGIPMTIIEAMGTGLPVVSTNVGGIPELITDGREGILCACDENELYAAMKRMFADGEFRANCGKNALVKASRFSSEEMCRSYLELYLKQ